MDRIASARLRELVTYWNARRAGRTMPARADIDPVDIPHLLRSLRLIDVERAPRLAFRYRVVGTESVRRMRRDITGQHIDESVFGAHAAEVFHAHAYVVTEAAAVGGMTRSRWPGTEWTIVEWVILPLGADHRTADRLLVGNDTQPDSTAPGDREDTASAPELGRLSQPRKLVLP